MRNRIIGLAILSSLVLLRPAASSAVQYKVDPAHTAVTFQVRHLFSKVNGRFDKFDGKIDFDPGQLEKTVVEGSIDAASINTNEEKRDKHLRSKAFFHAEKYPKITFASTGVSDVDMAKKTGKLHGNLTIHGVEKPVVLDVAFLGAGKDPWGNERAGFTAKTTINRKDYGLTWNETLETGGVLVGDDIEIEIDAEGLVEN